MRKTGFLIALALSAFMVTSCYTEPENELAALERRLNNLTQRVNAINDNIISLQTIAEKYKSYIYVSSYTAIRSGRDIIGYTIKFSDGTSITLNNGVSKDDPIIGLQLGEDGLYYWIITVNGKTDFIYDESGEKVTATKASPIMKIIDGRWQVSFDNGATWQSYGKAQGADGTSYVDRVETKDGYIYFYLVSGKTVVVPSYELYESYLQQLNTLNANLAALNAIYQAKNNKTYVRTAVPITENGQVTGYQIIFSDNTAINIYHGRAYQGQDIGLVQYEDGELYWAVYNEDGSYQWLYDDLGRMVQGSPIDGQSPTFILDDSSGDGKYYWAYRYGESGPKMFLLDADGNKVLASNANVIQVFSDITVNDSYVLLTPLAGSPFSIPLYEQFTVYLSKSSVSIPADPGYVEITYEVRNVDSSAAITAVTDKGYHASITRSYDSKSRILLGKIRFTADSSASKSATVLLLISDGNGHTETRSISVSKK